VLLYAPYVLIRHDADQEPQAIFWGPDAESIKYVYMDGGYTISLDWDGVEIEVTATDIEELPSLIEFWEGDKAKATIYREPHKGPLGDGVRVKHIGGLTGLDFAHYAEDVGDYLQQKLGDTADGKPVYVDNLDLFDTDDQDWYAKQVLEYAGFEPAMDFEGVEDAEGVWVLET
jgi:hypothetical protein